MCTTAAAAGARAAGARRRAGPRCPRGRGRPGPADRDRHAPTARVERPGGRDGRGVSPGTDHARRCRPPGRGAGRRSSEGRTPTPSTVIRNAWRSPDAAASPRRRRRPRASRSAPPGPAHAHARSGGAPRPTSGVRRSCATRQRPRRAPRDPRRRAADPRSDADPARRRRSRRRLEGARRAVARLVLEAAGGIERSASRVPGQAVERGVRRARRRVDPGAGRVGAGGGSEDDPVDLLLGVTAVGRAGPAACWCR